MWLEKIHHLVGQIHFSASRLHVVDPVLALFVSDIEGAVRINHHIETAALPGMLIGTTEEFAQPQSHTSGVIFCWIAEQG
jgi:hypothetical protein